MSAAIQLTSPRVPTLDYDGHIHLPNADVGLPAVWLRDNCRCASCCHPQTGERLLFSAAIAPDIRPWSMEVTPTGDLLVIWDEEAGLHISIYPAAWLGEHASRITSAPLCPPRAKLWRGESLDLQRFDWADVMTDDDAVVQWSLAIMRDGVARIENTPPDDGEVERVASRLAHVRETGYDRLHNVRSDPAGYNVASTDVELKVHTDMPNYTNPPGVQLLHFVENGATGGETTLTDGFAVAHDLAEEEPEMFQVLCQAPVSFRMTSTKADILGTSRLVTLDPNGTLDIIRFSNQLMQPVRVKSSDLGAFYDAYRAYSERMVSPEYMASFRAEPGSIVTTHNHRVLHGRACFDPMSGPRHLQLSYMDFDDVISRARVLTRAAMEKVS